MSTTDPTSPPDDTDTPRPSEGADETAASTARKAGSRPSSKTQAPPPAGLAHRRVLVEVPATSANLGAGYDALAIALDLVDRFEVEVKDEPGIELLVEGEGAGPDGLAADPENRFVVAFETGLRWALGELPSGVGWRIAMHNRIPLARGLGSSAAATVGGLVAADALAGGNLERRKLATLSIEIEGHPDNAAAALEGGFCVTGLVDGRPESIRFDVPRDLRVILFVPELELATGRMRAVLPPQVPHRDAVFNVGRVALGVAGLAMGRSSALRVLTQDRLHEPYRAEVYPALPRLVQAARDAGALGACLSGSGSTVIAFGESVNRLTIVESALMAVAADAGLAGVVHIVRPRNAGAVVLEAR